MKPIITITLFVLSLNLFFSCKKDKASAPAGAPPVTTSDSILSLNVYLPEANSDTSSLGKNYELIISEANDTILLDTLAAFNNVISVKLKASQSFVDLTTIEHNSRTGIYGLTVYKAVDPSSWVTLSPDYFGGQSIYPSPSTGYIYYSNVPAVSVQNYEFESYLTDEGNSLSYNSYSNILTASYGYYPNDVAYLLLPTLGLYNFHPTASNSDTVDLTQMDSTTNVNFNIPAPYTFASAYLLGIMDTTDLTKVLYLYNYMYPNPLANLEYPSKKFVQKYGLSVSGTTNNNETVGYSITADTVTTTLPFPLPTSYTLTSTQNNNFIITFNSISPTFYETQWNSGNIQLVIYAPSDSTVLQPLNLMTSLKSQMMQGQTLSGLALHGLGFTMIPGVSYETYFSTECNPALALKASWPISSDYWKNF